MTAWKETTFSDLGQCIRGVSYKPHNLREASGTNTVTLLRSNNIRDGRLNFHDVQYVEAHMVRPEQHLKHSDIAVCMSNGNRALVGKAGQFDEASITTAYTVGAFCSIFRPAAAYESDFVHHQFSSPLYQQQLDSLLAGSAINNLKGLDVAALKASVPTCRREQSKIAEVLSTVDRAIEETEALIAKQQRIKTGLMQDLLTRGIDEHGNLRSEQTHKFKDSPLGRIPVEWDVTLLDSLAVRGSGHTPNKQRPAYWNGGIKWVSLADSRKLDNLYMSDTDKEISDLGLKNSSAVLHPAGTVILSRDAGVGKSAILGHEMAVSQHFMAWRCRPTKLDNLYLYYWLQRDKPIFEGIASGSTIVTIGLQFFRAYSIAAPREVDEQVGISTKLKNTDSAIAQTTLHSRKLHRLKTALMQDLLTGNRRVTALLEQDAGATV